MFASVGKAWITEVAFLAVGLQAALLVGAARLSQPDASSSASAQTRCNLVGQTCLRLQACEAVQRESILGKRCGRLEFDRTSVRKIWVGPKNAKAQELGDAVAEKLSGSRAASALSAAFG